MTKALIQAGRLRHYVTVEALTITDQPDGTYAKSWSSEGRHASIEPLSGRELFEAQQMKGEATHKVTMRHYAGLTPEHRIKFNGRTFNVVGVQNIEERGTMTVAYCKESV